MALNVAIIGGGIAGLSLGTYLQLNGFESEIFETQDYPGGVCTSWKRKGYLIDGGIRTMVGIKQPNPFHDLWNSVMDLDEMEFSHPEEHFVIEGEDGRRLVFYSDLGKLEQELTVKCPDDTKAIGDFINTVRKYEKLNLVSEKPPQLMKLKDQVSLFGKILPSIISFTDLINKSNFEYSERFKDPLLRRAFREGFIAELPVLSTIQMLGWVQNGEAAHPLGGGMYLARRLEKKYLNLGGTIHYNRKVEKVMVEDDKATGVACCDGNAFYADVVVSAADGMTTLNNMVDDKYLGKNVADRFSSGEYTSSPPQMFFSLGLNRDMTSLPRRMIFPVRGELKTDTKTAIDFLDITKHDPDGITVPQGKTLLTLTPRALYWEWWIESRKNDRPAYNALKKKVIDDIIDQLEEHLGPLRDDIEMTNLATPATYKRYTNNWKGSPKGWWATPRVMGKKPVYELKGLKDFYMVGQWATTGGLHNVVMSSNHVAQLICNKFNLDFHMGVDQ